MVRAVLERPVDTHQLQATVETITPELASEYLKATREGNRHVRALRAARYASEMAAGRWLLTHQGVAFDWNGRLFDGQHRLLAIIESGTAVELLVVRGVNPEAFKFVDIGAPRTGADVFEMRGETYTSVLAGITRLQYKFDRGELMSRSYVANADLLDTLEQHPGLRASTHMADHVRGPMVGTVRPTIIAFLHYRLSQVTDPDDVEAFFDGLLYGVDLDSDDARLRGRESLLAAKGRHREYMQYEELALLIKIWNAWRTGSKVGKLMFRPVQNEEFPQIEP